MFFGSGTQKQLCIVFFALFILSNSVALCQQSNGRVDFQAWTDVNLSYYINQKFSIGGDIGFRGFKSSKGFSQIYIRPSAQYHISSIFRITGGIGSFNSLSKSISNAYEIRLFQDAHISWPDIGFIDFYHRFRFEERFFFYEKIDNEISVRGRYLFRVRTLNFKLVGKRKGYYLTGMWEAFIPFGESAPELFINNQRWYVALGYQPSDRYRYELFHIWQKSREFVDDGFETSENIIRLRFFYTIKPPEQE